MKLLILTILLIISITSAYSQTSISPMMDTLLVRTDTASYSDTLVILDAGVYRDAYVTISDTQTTAVDTVIFENYDTQLGEWVRVGVTNLFTNAFATYGLALVGNPQKYYINDKSAGKFRARLKQSARRATMLKTTISGSTFR